MDIFISLMYSLNKDYKNRSESKQNLNMNVYKIMIS